MRIRCKQKLAEENFRDIKLVFDKAVTYPCVIPTKSNVKRTWVDPCYVVAADSLQFYLNQSLKLFQIINSDTVVGAVCSVIAQLSLAGNGMMNKLTIKLAGRQAQGMGIFPSFHGSSKEKARRRNSFSSNLGKLSRRQLDFRWEKGGKRSAMHLLECVPWCRKNILWYKSVVIPRTDSTNASGHEVPYMYIDIKWYRPIATKRVLILTQLYFSGNRWKVRLSNDKCNHDLAHLLDS